MVKKKTETVVVTWRVKEALRRRLEAAAAHNEVSVNAEITRRIEESFSRAELASLSENVDRLSALYEHTRVSSELVERYRLNAAKCLELAQTQNDPGSKVSLLNLASSWLALAAQCEQNTEAASEDERAEERLRRMSEAWAKLAEQRMKSELPDLDLSPRAAGEASSDDVDLLSAPPAPAETDEERQTRLRALADALRKNAERAEARSTYDLGAEPREWDTRARSVPPRSPSDQEAERSTARSKLRAREPNDETDLQRQARVRATAEGFRRNAKRHEARGAHDKAAQAREWADKLERDAFSQGQALEQPRSVSDQERELPMSRQKGGK